MDCAISKANAPRLCPPYKSVRHIESKEFRPLFRLWARGVALIPLLPSPSRSRGMARRQGAAWIAPGWNGLGVKRHALRLAARQRGILAFMPLTVVGPGRLLVADEAARVRPGDEGCVVLRSQVPLPFPAYR